MMKFSKLIKDLNTRLFRKKITKRGGQPYSTTFQTPDSSAIPLKPLCDKPSALRDPYFVQIGFDFGTSYSKCVCRDVMIDKAWIHISNKCAEQEHPFLTPSVVILKDKKINSVDNPLCQYPENGLYHLKHALVTVALNQFNDPVLIPYKNALGSEDPKKLRRLVESCAVYFLAGMLGEVRVHIRRKFPKFGSLPEDYIAVNLAVPVASVQNSQVNTLYHSILNESWCLSDELAGHPSMQLSDLESMRREKDVDVVQSMSESCFIYPEVSANVQGFVRSRVSAPGVYLFSDTGASTVDQGIFIFIRRDGGEFLTYLYGSVLPLGSSQIEQKAAENTGAVNWQSLESWREIKERGESIPEIRKVKEEIAEKLVRETIKTLAGAKMKLFVKEQLNEVRLIFGGGGHIDYPYKFSVMQSFTSTLFRNPLKPEVVNLPIPKDIELNDSETRWMRRLSVAYGLSFEKSVLAGFAYPKDVPTPTHDQLWPPRKKIEDAPSKDVC